MAAADKKKLAALVVAVLALLAGPAASDLLKLGLGTRNCSVFVGWPVLSFAESLVCGLLGNPSSTPPASPPPTTKASELRVGYYSNSNCTRDVEAAVREVVEKAISQQGSGIGAGLIRLFFHDAFVRGCDASVLLNTTATRNTDTERTGPPNANSLRGFEVIDAAKNATIQACDGHNVVSCADILAFAARDAARKLSGGYIDYKVEAGRYDGRTSRASETNTLPGPDSTLDQLKTMFKNQNLTLKDMVALSAAHSIGRARCLFFTNRASTPGAMDDGYAQQLLKECNGTNSPSTTVNQDYWTPNSLDIQYYKNIGYKYVLFGSDAALTTSDEATQMVNAYIDNPSRWYSDFAAAMGQMGRNGVRTQPSLEDEIREVCWRVNNRVYY